MAKPVHFTYEEFEPDSDLFQGDIIQPTKEMRSIFEEVHKHFLDPKYSAFLVLTQTCDLVRRDGQSCKSPYINLAVVRPLEEILISLLDQVCDRVKVCGHIAEGIYLEESRFKAEQLLHRIFNQNEQSLGLFFLYPETAVQIAVPSVALLQVSIALRAREHYIKLIKSRSGRLRAEFRSKLGWLIGNLFSRVATEDLDSQKRKELISRYLDSDILTINNPHWMVRSVVKEANKANVDIKDLNKKDILDCLKQHQPSSPLDMAIEQVQRAIQKVLPTVSDKELQMICGTLRSDKKFESTIK